MSLDRREEKALARWRVPRSTVFNRALTALVVGTSRFIMQGMNRLEIEGAEKFEALCSRGGRGLLTFSNHVSLFDDPLLLCNLRLPLYPEIRWVGSDAINFFGSPLKAFIFTAGKCVPLVRGAGLDQPGFDFLGDRLKEGAWVHMFPEGGRTRDRQALLSHPFKPGIGRLIVEARPVGLPFYHFGMHEVLPLGTKLPRWRKTVKLVFGEPIDYYGVIDEICSREGFEEKGPRQWDALTRHTYETLRVLELRVHPAALSAKAKEAAR